MVYYPRNSSRRLIDREPPRRDYYSHHAPSAKLASREDNYYYHHALSAKPASREDYYYNRRGKYDKLPGDFVGYRRNYSSSTTKRRLDGHSANFTLKSSSRRSNWTVHSYKPYQSSSSIIRRPNYGIERDRNERKYLIPVRRYNRKPTFPPCNNIKFSCNRDGGNYHGRKMHHRGIKTYNNQIRNRRMAATFDTGKHHSPQPPPLPESEFMVTDHNGSPALSSPSYSEEEGELRSCSPVLECSSDNTDQLLEFTAAIAGST